MSPLLSSAFPLSPYQHLSDIPLGPSRSPREALIWGAAPCSRVENLTQEASVLRTCRPGLPAQRPSAWPPETLRVCRVGEGSGRLTTSHTLRPLPASLAVSIWETHPPGFLPDHVWCQWRPVLSLPYRQLSTQPSYLNQRGGLSPSVKNLLNVEYLRSFPERAKSDSTHHLNKKPS